MIEISARQTLMTEELVGVDARKMSEEARNMKRETVCMHAWVLIMESRAIHLL